MKFKDFLSWALMEEAVKSYVSCSSILLPDSSVIVERLAYLMSTPNRDWSLVALFDSLCRRNEVSFVIAVVLLDVLLQLSFFNFGLPSLHTQ